MTDKELLRFGRDLKLPRASPTNLRLRIGRKLFNRIPSMASPQRSHGHDPNVAGYVVNGPSTILSGVTTKDFPQLMQAIFCASVCVTPVGAAT
jgi:hypothetical protein